MAEFDGDRRKRQETTMADDVILEIVKRLPHKNAFQCTLLNKNFRHRISQPNFLPPYSAILQCSMCSDGVSRSRMIFSSICREIRSNSTINHPLRRSETPDVDVSIIASCNGLLLLRFDNPYTHCFFNPATSEIAAAPSGDLAGFYEFVGLAVNWNWKSPIKLVSARCQPGWIRFTVVVPSPTGSGEFSRYEVDFDCEWIYEHNRLKMKPVYAHGSLYWLSPDGGFLVAFDVEKEEARLIDGPPEFNCLCPLEFNYAWDNCLGFADGEIHLVCRMMSGVVIYGHDHRTDGWRVKHWISYRSESERSCIPVFLEDELLLFIDWYQEIGYNVRYYDVKREVWENTEFKVLEWDADRRFFSYSSSFAKVLDTYLNENNTNLWKNEGRRNALLELQKLLIREN